jgi:hypothetical protein
LEKKITENLGAHSQKKAQTMLADTSKALQERIDNLTICPMDAS